MNGRDNISTFNYCNTKRLCLRFDFTVGCHYFQEHQESKIRLECANEGGCSNALEDPPFTTELQHTRNDHPSYSAFLHPAWIARSHLSFLTLHPPTHLKCLRNTPLLKTAPAQTEHVWPVINLLIHHLPQALSLRAVKFYSTCLALSLPALFLPLAWLNLLSSSQGE